MLKNELDKIYKELIEYSKSKFLKAEIKEAYFQWHENPYSNRELEYLDKDALEFKTFIDWFIFDYTLISLKKTLATIYWEENKDKLDSPELIEKDIHPFELVGNMTIIAAVSGIIGAKLFHNLENIGEFMADPIGQLMAFSGLTFYGGLIAGAVAVIWYGRKYNIKPLHLADSAAPGLMLAYGVGRIGCQLSGDGDWGINNLAAKPEWMSFLPDWMWSYTFPHNVIRDTGLDYYIPPNISDCIGTIWEPYCYQLVNPVWPTAFYEVVMCLLIFSFLWSIRKRIKIAGIMFFTYLALNGVERFFIEKIRVNTEYNILGGITQAEIISFCLVVLGFLGAFFLYQNSKRRSI